MPDLITGIKNFELIEVKQVKNDDPMTNALTMSEIEFLENKRLIQ